MDEEIKLLGFKDLENAVLEAAVLTHCRLNKFSQTIYWKRPISFLGTRGVK